MKLAHTMTAIFLGTAIVLVGFGAMATEGIGADALKVSLVLLLIGVAVGFSGWRVLSRDLRSVRSSLSTLKNDKGKLENELGQEKVQVKKLHENANLLKNDLLELKKINETLNSEKLVLEAQTKHFSVEFSQIK